MQSKAVLQYELYCRLSIDKQIVNASEFMPFIELLSLGSQLDRCLLTTISKQNILVKSQQPVAINLTHDSILDSEFGAWLADYLKQSSNTDLMRFELPESALVSAFAQCQTLIEVIRAAGAKIGIDQCGRQIGSLEYLAEIQPDYIKLDQSFAFYQKQKQGNEMCRALVNMAKGLNIEVIITGIENEEQLAQFSNLRAEGYQGYITAPTDLPD